MDRYVHLPLYGTIEHGPELDLAWQLYQTRAMARLRDVSLSSVPSAFAPQGMATTRFQHSVAVAHLARRLCELQPALAQHRDVLQAAALLHDAASPPFSHIAEPFLYATTGQTHEQRTEKLLHEDEQLQSVLCSYDVDPEQVVRIINGDEPLLGALIAGSLDMDNVSNTVDLLASLGYQDVLPYSPLHLVEAFTIVDGEVALRSEMLRDLLGWAEARRMLYSLLMSEPNLSGSTMLHRALESAYLDGVLDESFYMLDEPTALAYLRQNSDSARVLLGALATWHHYPRIYQTIAPEDARFTALYDDWALRHQFADELAGRLGVPPSELTFYVGRDRAEKTVHLPFVGPDSEAAATLMQGHGGAQRVAVFTHKRHLHLRDKTGQVAAEIEALVSQLPARTGGHVFF